MKLYMHPASTTSRPVVQFIADNGIKCDLEVVDIFTGAHYQEPFKVVNPNRMIPVLEDDGFRLTESSAILKYLADKINSPTYPKDLKQRAKINEVMDWFNTNFYRDFGYGLIYPQILGHHKRPSDEGQKVTVAWGKEKTQGWLQLLNDYWLGPNKKYLCGDQLTIADYFGVSLTTIGELVGCNFAKYPNVARWLKTMKSMPSYPKVYEVFNGFVESVKGQPFIAA